MEVEGVGVEAFKEYSIAKKRLDVECDDSHKRLHRETLYSIVLYENTKLKRRKEERKFYSTKTVNILCTGSAFGLVTLRHVN